MAATAAYAAVVSLMHALENMQLHRLQLDNDRIETLREKVNSLLDFLELHSQRFCTDQENLARQIADVADEAELVIDRHVVDQLSQRSGLKVNTRLILSFSDDMDIVIEKIESIEKDLMMIKDQESAIKEPQRRVSSPAAGSSYAPPTSSGKNTMVGFEDHLDRIMDQLTGGEYDLKVVPIVGMGGIGKTTLAKNIFDNQVIVDHFDKRIWFTISQKYSAQEILLALLHGDLSHKESNESLVELGQQLYKSLFGRRYLIVMDDVWSINIWDDLKSFFPKNKNGSRVIVTTRLGDVGDSLGNHNSYSMKFLDEKKSWELFCEKAFAKNSCPSRLEAIAKNITNSCKGLPLAIVVIGGLLANSDMTHKYWEFVAKNVSSFANLGYDEHCLKILSLSYNHLPIHLKSCFLYMRVFGEDEKIIVSKLIKSWVAEGFVKSKGGQTLEEVAHECLKDLIGRNLILIDQLEYNGEVKTCKIHDFLRDLCLREHKKGQYIYIPKVQTSHRKPCFLCSHRNDSTFVGLPEVLVVQESTSLTGCFVCNSCSIIYSQFNRLKLVLGVNNEFPILWQPTRLLCLYVCNPKLLSAGLSLLCNLQTLVVDEDLGKSSLPSIIWEMPQLRHIKIGGAYLCDPPITTIERKDTIILKNLQTLSKILDFRCSDEIYARIPNLKELKIILKAKNLSNYLLCNLHHLCKLESLTLSCNFRVNLEEIAFPHMLKKLSISLCKIPWEKLTIIGSLPNLEVLKLKYNMDGPEWNSIKGDFLRLKSLLVVDSNLERWNAEKIHFPNLEILALDDIMFLEKIPSGIGEIETLRLIKLNDCNESTVNSAKEMLEEQRSFGNEDLQLHVGEIYTPSNEETSSDDE